MKDISAAISKNIEDIKAIVAVLDPKGEIKVTRTEALEWWDRARIKNKRDNRGRMTVELEIDARKGDSLEINLYKKEKTQPRVTEAILAGKMGPVKKIYIGGEWDEENDEMVDPILTITIR